MDGGTVRDDPPSLERDGPVDADVDFDTEFDADVDVDAGFDADVGSDAVVDGDILADGATTGVRDDSERVSVVEENRETTVGAGAPVTVMASAASAASAEARGLVRPSVRDETRGVVTGCAPSSATLVVRASSRRRKDSAAAAPAPVTTADRDDVEFAAREEDVDRVPTVDVGVDPSRGDVPVAVEVRLWIVPIRSDDEDASMPICRSATVRATNPTNGERAEPPGKVVTRSTVAVGCRRGPVRADTVRRTFWRRRTGDELGRNEADDVVERRAVMLVADVDRVVDEDPRDVVDIADDVADDGRRADAADSRLVPDVETVRRFGADSDAWVAT